MTHLVRKWLGHDSSAQKSGLCNQFAKIKITTNNSIHNEAIVNQLALMTIFANAGEQKAVEKLIRLLSRSRGPLVRKVEGGNIITSYNDKSRAIFIPRRMSPGTQKRQLKKIVAYILTP